MDLEESVGMSNYDPMPWNYTLSKDTVLLDANTPIATERDALDLNIDTGRFNLQIQGFVDPKIKQVQESAKTYGT
jgi:hypothetical protein